MAIFSVISFFRCKVIEKNRTRSVFMLQRWLAYQKKVESIRNKLPDLDFLFSPYLSCNMDLKSDNFCEKCQKLDFTFFLLDGSWKKSQTKIRKTEASSLFLSAKFWYVNHLCNMKTHWLLFFLLEWDKKIENWNSFKKLQKLSIILKKCFFFISKIVLLSNFTYNVQVSESLNEK